MTAAEIIAVTVGNITAHPAVESLDYEEDWHNDNQFNWWCYLRDGWICPSMECALIHEHTLEEVAELLETCIQVNAA